MRSGSIHTYHDGAVCLLKKCYGFGKGFFLQVEHVLPINRCAWCEFLRVATRMTSSSAVRRSQFHMHFTSQFGSFHIQVLGPRLWIRLCNFVFVSSAMCWTCTFRKKRPFPISSQKKHITNRFNKTFKKPSPGTCNYTSTTFCPKKSSPTPTLKEVARKIPPRCNFFAKSCASGQRPKASCKANCAESSWTGRQGNGSSWGVWLSVLKVAFYHIW